jgi:peptidyl-prolyl cis-trans isomerase SurA
LGVDQYTVVKLVRKIPPHRANIVDDYQTIKLMLENEKREDTFKDWIEEKQKETYISISGDWRDCSFEFEGWMK